MSHKDFEKKKIEINNNGMKYLCLECQVFVEEVQDSAMVMFQDYVFLEVAYHSYLVQTNPLVWHHAALDLILSSAVRGCIPSVREGLDHHHLCYLDQ